MDEEEVVVHEEMELSFPHVKEGMVDMGELEVEIVEEIGDIDEHQVFEEKKDEKMMEIEDVMDIEGDDEEDDVLVK